jgi:hypothetical protein
LVIEHGFLVGPEQRAGAIRLGVPITVQHPLLSTLAAELIPFTCEVDQLAELEPTLTVVGGRGTWDPQGRLG